MNLTPEIKKKLKSFNFKYAEHIEGNVYKIQPAKKIFPKPSKPHVLDEEHMCFWHEDCGDHACCIELKDVLIF